MNRIYFRTCCVLIFESTGSIHQEAEMMLRRYAEKAAEVKKIDANIVFGYVMNRLSFVLQRNIANAINSRVSSINSHATRAITRCFEMSDTFVITHKEHNSRSRASFRED